MESFLIPLLIVVVVVVLGLLAMKYLGSRSRTENDGATRGRSSRGPAAVASREESVKASARLNQQQHSAIYALLARGDALNAIMEYRKATGAKLREAATAVASMSTYPQAYGAPPAPSTEATEDARGSGRPGDVSAPDRPEGAGRPGTAGETGSGLPGDAAGRGQAGSPGSGPLGPPAHPVIPDTPESLAGPAPAPRPEAADATAFVPRPKEAAGGYRYRAIVSQGDEIREIASTRLNDDVFARIKDQALGGDREAAVRLLMEHSDADEQQARDFVRLIQPEPPAKPEG
ncbi:hypothetical protein [Arthrobacter sp. Marseille-P9274]|uniref:hypothetical protein n=1 Tax=Arthrobacter sp. Marseille-P9274 TaxID=2866572 RepID=UPI0021C8D750|nr:hypothetical protein [Arthrobacter sp. Marseille-P9274]